MTDVDDKIRASANAIGKKVDDTYKDLNAEYRTEKYETHVESESEIGKDMERGTEKVETAVKAVANNVDEEYRDLKTDYRNEKIKQKLD